MLPLAIFERTKNIKSAFFLLGFFAFDCYLLVLVASTIEIVTQILTSMPSRLWMIT